MIVRQFRLNIRILLIALVFCVLYIFVLRDTSLRAPPPQPQGDANGNTNLHLDLEYSNSNYAYLAEPPEWREAQREWKWNNTRKNELYNRRYWDLMHNWKSGRTKTKPVFDELSKYQHWDNLWAPVDGQGALSSKENHRTIPQMVWGFEAEEQKFVGNKTKTILLPNGFKWWYQEWKDPTHLSKIGCGDLLPPTVTSCIFTENKHLRNSSSLDAVIFGRDWKSHGLNFQTPDHVLRFTYILESPYHSEAILPNKRDYLATYWRGSDIVTSYGVWVPYSPDKFKYKKPIYKNYAFGKKKPIAAFISNCYPENDRMGYIKELQKYIPVDVYGRCGPLKCEKREENHCLEMVKENYFFYLAFENSNCRDYITEKFYMTALKNDLVPVVMGAHPTDYEALAPPNSFIHVEDFESPEGLAGYLKFLMRHPVRYNSYFDWKGTGEFINHSFFCQVCAMVHYADFIPPPDRKKPFQWNEFSALNSGMCLPKGQWYWRSRSDSNKTTSNPIPETRRFHFNAVDKIIADSKYNKYPITS